MIMEMKTNLRRPESRWRRTWFHYRFKSVIVENGETLINCLAYIDLKPLRAGLVERPEQSVTRLNYINHFVPAPLLSF